MEPQIMTKFSSKEEPKVNVNWCNLSKLQNN